MSNPFEISNTLHRDGNSQAQRELTARQPSAAPADGRDVLDILSFLNAFAKEVNFYDLKDGVGDWTPFFQQSVPFRLAAIAQFDAEKWWNNFQKNRENGDVEAIMGQLFYAFVQHQQWHLGLHPPKLSLTEGNVLRQEWRVGSEEDNNPVRIVLKNLSDTNLRFLLLEYIGLFNTLKEKFQFPLIQNLEVFFSKEATTVWKFKPDNLAQPDAELKAKIGNKTTILPTLLPRLDRIAELIYKAQRAIGEVFTTENPDTLIFDNEEHEPHLGLLFAFLRLFKYAQGDMDNLTQRQLEFFYKDVLLFQERAAIPDKAHLVFELAKHIQGVHLLKQDTAYKDGKDNNKAEIIFSTDKETALNKATVAEVRTLLVENNVPYVFKQEGGDSGESFASFGESDVVKKGRVGFVLTSSVLRMREGARKVTINLNFETPLSILEPITNINLWTDAFKIAYTTKDKWEELGVFTPTFSLDIKTLIIEFSLLKDAKPVEPLEDKTLNPFGMTEPMIRISFKKENSNFAATYKELKTKILTSTTLTVDVSEVKEHLKVQNDDGILDTKKPFQPFGVNATRNFYIGSEEIFSKHLTTLTMKSTLENLPTDDYFHFYSQFLNGVDNSYPKSSFVLKTSRLIHGRFEEVSNNIKTLEVDWLLKEEKDSEWKASDTLKDISFFIPTVTLDGYIRLEPNRDFFQGNYSQILNTQALALADLNKPTPTKRDDAVYRLKGTASPFTYLRGTAIPQASKTLTDYTVDMPFNPYIPLISDFSLTYQADATDLKLLRFHPFDDAFDTIEGSDKAKYDIEGITTFKDCTTKQVTLVPNSLIYIKDCKGKEPMQGNIIGNLYLALKDAIPASKHSLLFQFAEYTGNPDLDFPPIKWFYLKDNNAWQELTKAIDYDDDTEGFAQSGIIAFTLPKDAATEQTILPKGYHWLRASVTENAAAFDRLLAVHAQAAKVTFTPSVDNDLERLSEPLPEKSIKKPVIENAGIAKIEQFYPSVEGSVPEKEAAFYRRVSERLRHKGRAVTIWDYEALVLEAFPQIYKVKCLNHTEILRGGDYDFEIMPTKVAVVVIPNVQKLPQAQKDTPKANQNMLGDIHRFLETRLSPFVGLEVLNPRYEPVNVAFNVKFHPDFDVNFYKKQLQEDLKQHLSPWTKAEPAEIQFGGEIYFSSVLKFVEEQPYVDYVTNFTLQGNGSDVGNRVVAKTARSVLSSGSINITIGDANC